MQLGDNTKSCLFHEGVEDGAHQRGKLPVDSGSALEGVAPVEDYQNDPLGPAVRCHGPLALHCGKKPLMLPTLHSE